MGLHKVFRDVEGKLDAVDHLAIVLGLEKVFDSMEHENVIDYRDYTTILLVLD